MIFEMFIMIEPRNWFSVNTSRFLKFKGFIKSINDTNKEVLSHFLCFSTHKRLTKLNKEIFTERLLDRYSSKTLINS